MTPASPLTVELIHTASPRGGICKVVVLARRRRSPPPRTTRRSHGGVDDTRDLRDRASFAPAQSRYRIFIIDEAHMVTTQGFNALLKIVEEPPEHVIFVFATTEPEKVRPTIRSRTHQYPFRLLAPKTMRGLVEKILESEHVEVDDAAPARHPGRWRVAARHPQRADQRWPAPRTTGCTTSGRWPCWVPPTSL